MSDSMACGWRARLRSALRPGGGRSPRDSGLTLPEVLIAVTITTLLVAAMATATQVVLSQQDNTVGRLNNARSEQSIGIWLPADLSSAETVDDSPNASPCGTQCPPGFEITGTNTLLLTWTGSIPGETEAIPTLTTVSYRYVRDDEGVYDLIRVQCLSIDSAPPTCEQTTVLHDVLPPPLGSEFIEGVTKPVWVMLVTLATDPAAPDDGSADSGCDPGSVADPTYYCKNGRRVTVTINGGGDIAGAGGGIDSITLTAGGTNRQPNLSTGALSASPTFAATRSRCGGNFGLLVDTSGSISGNMSYVISGVKAFIDAFAGTPIRLQVVRFSSTSSTLGAPSGGWTKYYDMLVESDVAALKTLVDGLSSTGATNWEDGFFRMFLNSDGTIQTVLPDTLIFFTDGMPTYSRLNSSSASVPAAMHNDDTDLPTASGSSYNQLSWNRANRVIREYEADLERLIGVYVGTNIGGSSTWLELGPGYHLVNFLRGYHEAWDRGFHVLNPQRGSHATVEYAGSGLTYQYASDLTYQYAASGQTWQYAATGMKFQRKQWGSWRDTDAATYFANNTNTGTNDGYRTVITGTLGTWTAINATPSTAKSKYDLSNTVAGQFDGFRNLVTGTLGTWSSSTKSMFDISNTTVDANDGHRVVVPGTITDWNTTTRSYYETNNAVPDSSDGYRVYVSGTLGSWTTTTDLLYNRSNSTADQSDGFRLSRSYTAPYVDWESVNEATYLANNTTSDNSDGWSGTNEFSAPYSSWTSVSQSTYDANNTTADDTDGWRARKVYASPFSLWEPTTESAYTSGNTSWGNLDGWDATKEYSEPYTFHEGYSSYSRSNTEILKQIVGPGGVVPAQVSGSDYTNSKEATYYELPQWDQFAGAMTSMALAECGGTVTLQTKIGSANAADPFTYQSSVDLTTATTSSQYRSGTFDYDLAGGVSMEVTISPMATSVLDLYDPAGWTCRSAGISYPFTTTPIDGGPWTSITLTVSPNKAVSCVQQVTLK